MSDYKQIERIIRILQRFALNREITVAELYKYFEGKVSKRTLERDLETLSSANIPLSTRKGKGRELIWYLEGQLRHFIPQTVGIRELRASLILQELADLLKGTPLANDAKLLLNKARQLYDPRLLVDADMLDGPLFGVSQTGHIVYAPYAGIIDDLIRAAEERRYCEVYYQGYLHSKPNHYRIAPYMIVLRKGALYIVAYEESRSHYILLLVHKIKKIEVSLDRFKRRMDFSLEEIKKYSLGLYRHESQKPVNVSIHFDPVIGDIIADRIWHPSQKINRHKDGSITFSMKVVISDELMGWIGSWMHYARVLKPKELRDEFKKRIGILKKYYEKEN